MLRPGARRGGAPGKKLIARAEELAWVVEYRADVEADFLAVYRIDDPMQMSGPRFFRLAWRLPHYQGAIRARAQEEMDDEAHAAQQGPRETALERQGEQGQRVDNWAAFALATGIPVERVEVRQGA